MANIKSAQKRDRQTKRRTLRNQGVKSRVKTLRKKTLTAAAAGDQKTAQETMKEFSSAVDKAVKKNLFHKNKGANLKRKVSHALKGAK
ncbi:MAG: 30S ribosomal protein S20 [Akkermansiaceae bacterium]|nr:30S ribosomal protein S20 [Akkermansiaceae bacterium]NNM29145.1 30S ribosomal protein S20 [Akkermansiaceae bacterium]